MTAKILQPADWMKPRGYSNAMLAEGKFVFIAGQVGWNERCEFVTDDFAAQLRQALQNVVALLAEGGAKPANLVRLTWYVCNKREYLSAQAAIGAAYREIIGQHYPVMTLVEVSALLEDRAKVEIEATAVIPK